jgi:alkanesulfonate monooxygenase SsuD/methylene tetrahydromethanopterin reductase-like flavin-dependent oxidoreductase (luciferase family)
MIAGNGERRTLRLVARHADVCNVYGGVEDVARKFEALRRHCEDVGRPYEEVTHTINCWGLLARDEAGRAAKRLRFPDVSSVDTAEETIEILRRYEDVGTQYVIVKLLNASDLNPVRHFAEEVLPAFAPAR